METKAQEKQVTIDTISIEYDTEPKMAIKDMAFNKALTLMVGANGSGKSMVMIHNYVLTSIVFSWIKNPSAKSGLIPFDKHAKYMFESCFDEVDWTGRTAATFSNGNSIEIVFDKGEIVSANIDVVEETATPAIYLSKNTRQFDYFHNYLRFRKMHNGTDPILKPEALAELQKDYKLYDLAFMEYFMNICPIINIPDMTEKFEGFNNSPDSIHVDYDTCKLTAVLKDGSERLITRYSAGEQAILVMFAPFKRA